ncbi:hypothetical protein BU24DRAFT_417677 [Aaosphaeria arxii CBS 175.79]|uniref:Uncharacterized protein n=1 Tax=Aaosphaeria arxii CBS 175.79 TaxID=1450172 RepID=A0A6A5Y9L5_9PLEO|nr:uncharacterized protein BU24DRAFT_417677 [Aaosphaeria arxii CBS 175.79]KAF2022029.1 hypothetical protein BU24DRAFT_417677 [Aaosphaeria arxii CBS 175.79]
MPMFTIATFVYIARQGTVYFGDRLSSDRLCFDDEDMLEFFSRQLIGEAQTSTFDKLYPTFSVQWYQQDDIIDVFDDPRSVIIETVWIFDLDGDILRFNKKDHSLYVPLSLVRQRPILISDFEPYERPTPPNHTLDLGFQPPYWEMQHVGLDLQCLARRKAFVCRALADFAFQWRHILCSRYNDSTFQRLAYGIVRIATFDFDVEEYDYPHLEVTAPLVFIHMLPEWESFHGQIVPVGRISVVLSRDPQHALALIRDDFANRSALQCDSSGTDSDTTYLILSVQHIVLYQISRRYERYTKPVRLLEGTHPPSDEAIELLLKTTQVSSPKTRINRLPVELQDMILDEISEGPIERARVGCILNAGTLFQWRSGGRDIEREESWSGRIEETPVESHILFGDHFSGVAYR